MHKLLLPLLLTFLMGLLTSCNEKFEMKGGFAVGNNSGNNTSISAPTFSGRGYHTATRLLNGKILIVGGENNDETLSLVQLFDPATNTISQAASLNLSRSDHTATLLNNGKVLIAGGYSSDQNWDYIASGEIYDPDLNTWTAVPDMPDAKGSHSAVALTGNKVLVTGGYDFNGDTTLTSFIYDGTSNSWAATTSMTMKRAHHTASVLSDGRVIVIGGYNPTNGILDQHEIYNPNTDSWLTLLNSNYAKAYHGAVVLPGDLVLVLGGYTTGWTISDKTEIYDVGAEVWNPMASMPIATSSIKAMSLANGKVIVAGGNQQAGTSDDLFLYDPTNNTWATSATLLEARRNHTTTVVDNDIIVTGGYGTSSYLKTIERFSATSPSWSFVITPPVRIVDVIPPADDNYVDGDVLSFSLTFEEPVILTGNVRAPVDTTNGKIYATATSSGAASTHTFQLVVDSSMQSDGINIQGSIQLNGGSIVAVDDGAAGDVDIPSESFSGVTINYKRPEVVSIVAPPDGNYYEGYELEFTVTFDEPVAITGYANMQIQFATGLYTMNSTTTALSATHTFKIYLSNGMTDMDGLELQGTLSVGGADTILSASGIPAKSTFTPIDITGIKVPARTAMVVTRANYSVLKLADNRLMVIGGSDSGHTVGIPDVEIFDPLSNSWLVVDSLNQARLNHNAHQLPNGKVVIFGGLGTPAGGPVLDTTEVYDFVSNTWTTVMPMSIPRNLPASILMTNGKILAMGGYTTGMTCVDSVEEFDPMTNVWTTKVPMVSGTQTQMTLVELANGSISKTGGGCWGVQRADEIYVP